MSFFSESHMELIFIQSVCQPIVAKAIAEAIFGYKPEPELAQSTATEKRYFHLKIKKLKEYIIEMEK